jgi:hypothetical protein
VPLISVDRDGEQYGAFAKALLKTTPFEANQSMLGVLMVGFPYVGNKYGDVSSITKNNTFGFLSAALHEAKQTKRITKIKRCFIYLIIDKILMQK